MSNIAYALRNEDFITKVDVSCPKCKGKAIVFGGQPYLNILDYESEVGFSCTSCGFNLKYNNTPKTHLYINAEYKKIDARVIYVNSPIDPYFGLQVWYQVETKFGLLWAYNEEHLAVIENYIADKLRSRNGLPYKNNSMGSRLPQWVKDAKNREYLLKQIAKLR